MKPTLFNRVKLWFHCLTRFHQDYEMQMYGKIDSIGCVDCEVG
jgi:hypothetical protein